MPEGHTVHRLAAEHQRMFGGRRVAASSPQGRFADGAARLDGRVPVEADARGERLLARVDHDVTLHVHPGIYGRHEFGAVAAPAPGGGVRRRGTGPGGWGAGGGREVAWRRGRRWRARVAGLLLDQAVAAGPGKMYRGGVLVRQGVAPRVRGRRVTRGQWAVSRDGLGTLMADGV